MKTLHSLLLISIVLILVSCGKDDDNNQGDPLQINLESTFMVDLKEEGVLNEQTDEYVFLRKMGDLVVLISSEKIVAFDSDGARLWAVPNNHNFDHLTRGLVNNNSITLFSDQPFLNTKLTLNKSTGETLREVNFNSLLPSGLVSFTTTIIGSKIYIFGIMDLNAPNHQFTLLEHEIGSSQANEVMSFTIPGKNYGGISKLAFDELNSTVYAAFNANREDNTAVVGLIKMDIEDNSHEIFELFEVDNMALGGGNRISIVDRTLVASGGGPDIKLIVFDLDSESLLLSKTYDNDFDEIPFSHFISESNDLLLFKLLINGNDEEVYVLHELMDLNIEENTQNRWSSQYYMIGQDLNSHMGSATLPLFALEEDFNDQFISQIHFVRSSNGERIGFFDVVDIEEATGFISNPVVCNEMNRLYVVDDNLNLHSFNYPF